MNNSLNKAAYAGAACGLAVLLMITTAPMTGINAGVIGMMMDQALGSSWQIIPLFSIIPFLMIFIIYACLIGGGICAFPT